MASHERGRMAVPSIAPVLLLPPPPQQHPGYSNVAKGGGIDIHFGSDVWSLRRLLAEEEEEEARLVVGCGGS